jgi:hypothetical protein
VQTTYPEYVVVEEHSDVDSVEVPRGRLRIRHNEYYDDRDYRRPLSPRVNKSYIRTSQENERYRYSDDPEPGQDVRSKGGYESPPTPSYLSVQPPPQRHGRYEERNVGYERRRAAEENVYISTNDPRSSRRTRNLEGFCPMPSREESFESLSSDRSDENRALRAPVPPNTPATESWGPPHIIHPQPGEEKVVVTETYVYRPRRTMNDNRRTTDSQREPRRFVDHARDGVRYDRRSRIDFSDQDHAYYQNDWEQEHREEPPRPEPRIGRGYRRGRVQDSELYSDITDSVTYREACTFSHSRILPYKSTDTSSDDAVHQNLPRAPTPPSILSLSPPDRRKDHALTQQSLPYPPPSISSESEPTRRRVRKSKTQQSTPYPPSISSDSEPTHCRTQKYRKGKEESPPSPSPERRARSRAPSVESNHRPPFVREATDGGTERALIPSPMRTRDGDPFADEFRNELTMTELSAMEKREKIAEREGKKVAFMGVGVDEGVDEVDEKIAIEIPVKKWDGGGRREETLSAGWEGGDEGGRW